MAWYAAHAIMYIEFANKNSYTIRENIILIEAESVDEAWEKSDKRAKEITNETNDALVLDESFENWKLAGIRKLISCFDEENQPEDGTEITYSELEIDDEASFKQLLKGDSVILNYEE